MDQNLSHRLSEEQMYPPDAVEHESAGVGCHSDLGSEGQLVIQCHNQVPGRPSH